MNLGKVHWLCKELQIRAAGVDGDWLRASCPFAKWNHKRGTDSNPSFGIKVNDTGRSGYYCFSCHEKGSIPHLVSRLAELRGEPMPELVAKVMDEDLLPESIDGDYLERCSEKEKLVDLPIPEAAAHGLFPPAWESPPARQYLQSRAISQSAALKACLGYDPEEKRVVFPVRDREGILWGWAGRSIFPQHRKKVKNYAGLKSASHLLGAERLTDNPIFVVEGVMAYAHLLSIGADSLMDIVATFGSRMSEVQAAAIRREARRTILCYDLDDAGENGLFGRKRDGAVYLLKDHVPTEVAQYPNGKTDVDDFDIEDIKEILEWASVFYP